MTQHGSGGLDLVVTGKLPPSSRIKVISHHNYIYIYIYIYIYLIVYPEYNHLFIHFSDDQELDHVLDRINCFL